MNRTHNCGELRETNINQEVTLLGWVAKRRNFGSLVFIDLRDRYGITQVIADETLSKSIKDLRSEFLIEVKGTVQKRKDANEKLATGQIEVIASDVTIINRAELPPILVQDDTDALEDTRLKYRYLDLRRPVMQEKLIKRAKIVQSIRNYLDSHEFIDIETPMLTKSTPEGSREYLVPSRVHPGEFYALAQSPQIFKQMLMVSGFERYYQVARCFRDEDLRADRQLDFTQVDIETSFLNQDEFLTLMEEMVVKVMKEVLDLNTPYPFLRLTYKEAMSRYGSDKPDNRFGLELSDVTDIFKTSDFKVFQGAFEIKEGAIKALVLNDGASFSRKESDALIEVAKKNGAKGMVVVKYINQTLDGSAAKFITDDELKALEKQLNLKDNDLICFTADQWEVAANALGAVRLSLRDKLNLTDKANFSYLWVTDFPMFEYDEKENRYVAKHHPFTRPRNEDLHYLKTDPTKALSYGYDLVLNGYEVGGGSLRIYDQEIQRQVFEIIGFSKEEIDSRFGFFIDAFKYGTPPHGGIALGLDRYAMVLTQSDSLRDVIAFPKNASAKCPLTDAPTTVTEKQLEELKISINTKN